MARSLKTIQRNATAKYVKTLEQKWAENQIHCAVYHAFYGGLPPDFAPVLGQAIRETPAGDLNSLLAKIPGLVRAFEEKASAADAEVSDVALNSDPTSDVDGEI